jgi:tungstate transport system substrate-binding protein
MIKFIIKLVIFLLLFASANTILADTLKLAVTTSFNNSGLSDKLLPQIKKDLDLNIKLLVVGTGQAIRLGKAGDVDAILVHSKSAEEIFVKKGFGTHRRKIMYNDFVIIGPNYDPAGLKKATNVNDALTLIHNAGVPFISRGDDSGTHKKEIALWKSANLDPNDFGDWYTSVGAGMGSSLNMSASMKAYVLSDRASWLNFKNKSDLIILFSDDAHLFNQYSFIPVSKSKHRHVKFDLAKKLEGWLTSPSAQLIIDSHQINGKPLFKFNASDK